MKVETGDLNISVHVPTLNEERYVAEALETLTSQDLYKRSDSVKIVLLDSNSEDNTVEVARPYVDEVYTTPKGKLSSRHKGLLWDEEADIVVSVDADTLYKDSKWLDKLLSPFRRENVILAHGPIYSRDIVWRIPYSLANALFRNRQCSASNSAFRRLAYFESCGFDLSIDEFDRGEIWREEEFKWPDRMRELGEVVFVEDAGVYTSMRNRFGTETDPEYVKQRERGVRF